VASGKFQRLLISVAVTGETHDEKNLSAKRSQTQTPSRFPGENENSWWPGCNQRTPGQGPGPVERLTGTCATPQATVSGYRFSRQHRLLQPQAFRTVLSQRCRSSDALFTIYARYNGLEHARLGITVSRKVSSHAVQRNRLKRLVRESFRYHGQTVAGLDVVAIAQPGAATSTNPYVDQSLNQHWTRVDRQCRKP
jgi:ribonuclease P protein component